MTRFDPKMIVTFMFSIKCFIAQCIEIDTVIINSELINVDS